MNPSPHNQRLSSSYALINVSRLGFRVVNLFIAATPETLNALVEQFEVHPNVGWIVLAQGWFTIGLRLWARTTLEIDLVISAIRRKLTRNDHIVYQSEVTTLCEFVIQPMTGKRGHVYLVDSTSATVQIDPLSNDYLKLLCYNSSLSDREYAEAFGTSEARIVELNNKLTGQGVIVGHQNNVAVQSEYYHVFIDSSSQLTGNITDVEASLRNDPNCISFARTVGQYDIELEFVIPAYELLQNNYLRHFTNCRSVRLDQYSYLNLYPECKIANVQQVKDSLVGQQSNRNILENPKLWYVDYEGVQAYLNLYHEKAYTAAMKNGEMILLEKIARYFINHMPDNIFSVVDLGSGDGLKAKYFIDELGEKRVKAYFPLDMQPVELDQVMLNHRDAGYPTHPIILGFENLTTRFPLTTMPGEVTIYMLLGGTYGNFEPDSINTYLSPLLTADKNAWTLISMPLQNSWEETIETYATVKFEDIAFGPLHLLGFKKEDFIANPNYPDLIVHLSINHDSLYSSFILRNPVSIAGHQFAEGTRFKITRSWKPTLKQFRQTVSKDLNIHTMFSNNRFAVALCQGSLP